MEREKLKEKAWAEFLLDESTSMQHSRREMWQYGFDAGWSAAQSWVRIETEADLPKVEGWYLVATRLQSGFVCNWRYFAEDIGWHISGHECWTNFPPPKPYDQTDGTLAAGD